jgi:hypothetical protein
MPDGLERMMRRCTSRYTAGRMRRIGPHGCAYAAFARQVGLKNGYRARPNVTTFPRKTANIQLAVDHVAPIEGERTEEPQTGSAQKAFEKESPATRPAFPAQTEERLVSIAQRLARSRSSGPRSRARAK